MIRPSQPELEFESARVKLLFGQSTATQSMGLLNYWIFYFDLRNLVPVEVSRAWIVACSVLFVARLGLKKSFQAACAKPARELRPGLWEKLFIGCAFLAGSCWGVAGFLVPHGALTDQMFLGFVLAGSTAGASIAYCVSLQAVEAFLLPAVLPFAFRLSAENGSMQWSMAALLGFYVVLITVLTLRTRSSFVDSIRLRFEKDRLLMELKETQSRIVYSERMAALGEMAAGIAHEINNPLTIIRGHNQTLRDAAESGVFDAGQITAAVEKSDQTVTRIARIVSALRAFARNEKGIPIQPIRLREIIDETLELCRARFERHQIPLVVGEFDDSLVISCRPSEISQVLVNLLNNAFDAVSGRQGAAISISVGAEGEGAVSIAVIDNGPGIPLEIRDKIMQPFFTTKVLGKGTGLGLSIARGIVQSHGGTLKLETSGAETRFVVVLPPNESSAA